MIEVEKKFIFSDENRKLLAKNAKLVSEKVFTDIYYDTSDFSLTSNDKWLRSRENRFELKIPLHQSIERLADQYDELEDEQKIRKALNLLSRGNLADDLMKVGYSPFCTCKTTRKKYKKESFIIDLDTVDFQDFTYNLGEIELMVSEKSETKGAVDKIMSFAKALKLTTTSTRGKVIEYLKRKKSNHLPLYFLAKSISSSQKV
jgi:predicted adenylyl cyclase CyaB